MSNRAVGIDLGTTYSAIAQVNKHGVPEILANAEGDRITPSVVLFDNDDIVVGNYAKQAAVAYPDQVVDFVKRYMGDPDYGFAYRTEVYTPEKLSSFILAKLKHDAEARLGHPGRSGGNHGSGILRRSAASSDTQGRRAGWL